MVEMKKYSINELKAMSVEDLKGLEDDLFYYRRKVITVLDWKNLEESDEE